MDKNCKKCGLYKGCKNPFLYENENSYHDTSTYQGGIIIVDSTPLKAEDDEGQFMQSPGGQFFRYACEELLEVPAVCHSAISCNPGYNRVTPNHLNYCRGATYDKLMKAYDPKVILCLGANALYWATGDSSLRLHSVRHKPFKKHGRWVIAVPHPSQDYHFAEDKKKKEYDDHKEEYYHSLVVAERIVKTGDYREPSNLVKIITEEKEALATARSLGDKPLFAMDVETGNNLNNPKAKTVYHPEACHIMTSWTHSGLDKDFRPCFKTYVFVGNANTAKVNRLLFKGNKEALPNPRSLPPKQLQRRVVAHNHGFDFKVHRLFGGFNPYDLCAREDTFYATGLKDQSYVGYSLKKQSKKFFGAEDWDKSITKEIKLIQKSFDSKEWGQLVRGEDLKPLNKKNKTYEVQKAKRDFLIKLYKRLKKNSKIKSLKIKVTDQKMYADYRHLDLLELANYCALDTYYTLRLYLEIIHNDAYEKCSPNAYKICMTSTKLLADMAMNGLPLNKKVFKKNRDKFEVRMAELREEALKDPYIKKAAKEAEFNPGGPKFLKALVNVTGVEVPLTAKTKDPAINKKNKVLYTLAKVDPVSEKPIEGELTKVEQSWRAIFNYRQELLLQDKFFTPYYEYVLNGLIHTTFRILKSEKANYGTSSGESGGGTVTGRLSTQNPPTQNIWDDPLVRECFRAFCKRNPEFIRKRLKRFPKWQRKILKLYLSHDWSLVEADYDRIELVFLAHLSQDPKMMEIFKKNLDMHLETAKMIFLDNSLTKKDPKRDVAKTLNFGLTYGQGVKAFAAMAGISKADAQKFFDRFWKSYPAIADFYKGIEQKVLDGEMVETIFGRRRAFRLVGDRGYDYGQMRQAKNYVVQSAASDSTLIHFEGITRWLEKKPALKEYIIPINTVHDSIWFMIRKGYEKKACKRIKRVMEDLEIMREYGVDFSLPINVSFKRGKNLANMKEFEV